MDVTTTVKPIDRYGWRAWLEAHHATAREIWLLFDDRRDVPGVTYLDAVEEALCFGWIDGIQKRLNAVERAQRFTPRRPRGSWTELNKARARRLIRLGLMTDAGRRTLPDLEAWPALAPDVEARLRATGDAWANWQAFPDLYRRVRLGNLESVRRDPVAFDRSLSNLVAKTAAGRLFGGWDDDGRLP
jgi:Bacteriocin-protection, YdeI or OmpD-Associated